MGNSNKNNNTKNRNNAKKVNWVKPTSLPLMLPIMAVLAIIPLIVKSYFYDCGLWQYDFFIREEAYKEMAAEPSVDFFLTWKMIFFIAAASIMACIIVYKAIKEGRKIKFNKVFIPLAVYALLVVLSSVFSQYRHYSFTGIYEQFESMFALLGYCVVAYYAFLYVNTKEDLNRIIAALVFSSVVILLIGISQAFFTDFYQTKLGAKFILGSDAERLGPEGLVFNFEKGRVYITVYNPNYVGSYVSLLMPVFLMLVFAAPKLWQKIGSGVLAVGMIFELLGSQSRAGFVGVIVSLILIVVVFNRRLLKNILPIAIAGVVLVGIVVGYDIYSGGLIRNKIKAAFAPAENNFDLRSIETLDDKVAFDYKGNILNVGYEEHYDETYGQYGYILSVTDADGKDVDMQLYSSEDGYFYYLEDDERYGELTIYMTSLQYEGVGAAVVIGGHEWNIVNRKDVLTGADDYYLYSPYGKLVKSKPSESVEWLEKRSGFASGRGFIWAKTIPLLKKYFVLGSGADTFSMAFPNSDFPAMRNGGFEFQLMTKPHNMYLQIGVQTGTLSMLAIMVYFVWFLVIGIGTMLKVKKYDFTAFVGTGILTGSAGYMVVQLINDSSICVAPFFWVLSGVGLAIFTMLKKEQEAELADALTAANE